MSNSRHGHWAPALHNQGTLGTAGSSPSTSGQTSGASNYNNDSHHPNGGGSYPRPINSNNPRYPTSGSNFSPHGQQQQANGSNLSPRTLHSGSPSSSSHMPGMGGGYGGAVPPQSHVEPSVFGDPRNANNSSSTTPGHFYGGYEQHQQHHHTGMPSSSFNHSSAPYGYNADANQNLSHQHSQHPQTMSHHSYPSSNWMNNSPQSSFPNSNDNYSNTKPGAYTQSITSQAYKSDNYIGQPNHMSNITYPSQMYQQEGGQSEVKLEVEDEEVDGEEVIEDGEGVGIGPGKKSKGQQGQKGTSEFVRKLFRMLDDTSYSSIVSWGPLGDSFIVKDMNDFTKHVLPRHFRHSNFASFVRQLNKYDFHKVKKPEDQTQQQHLGVDQLWEFRHPAFLQGREDMLENVKRKVPTGKKIGKKDGEDSPRDQSPTMPGAADAADKGAEEYSKLKDQVATLTASQDQMSNHINNLTKQYQGVIGEMLTFQKNMVQQDQLMQNLIQYLMNLEADRKIEAGPYQTSGNSVEASSSRPQLEDGDAFISSRDAERLVSNFSEVAKGSFSNMSEIAHRAARNGETTTSSNQGSTSTSNPTIAANMGYGDSRSSVTSNQAPLSPKSMISHDTPQDSNYSEKGKSKTLEPDGTTPSVYFHPPHYDIGQETSSMSGGHKELFNVAASAVNNPSLAGFEGAGLRVFTVGTLQPRTSTDESSNLDPNASTPATTALEKAFLRSSGSTDGDEEKPYGINVPNLESLPANMPRVDGRATTMHNATRTGGPFGTMSLSEDQQNNGEGSMTPSEGGQNMLRVRRSTYVPGWAVPPKVLVVDDDDVCRKLGSKFLQVFGCAIDVAVDGVTAVNKMNLEKYDLVLMDIVMPNLDGVSATSLIREFDPRTPIISMTSNSAPNELLSYMSSGMNDVLPKPFTKEGLLNMLEKHLIHLKTVQKMDEIPRSLGLPPVSDDMMQSVLSATAASASSMRGNGSNQGGVVNPMAAMMGNGPEALRASQEVEAGLSTVGGSAGLGGHGGGEDEDGIVNPLAGMGFSDEEYISMLQNLIAAGAVSDASKGENAESVANIMGVARGEGTMAVVNRSKESTPMRRPSNVSISQAGKKRSATADGGADAPDEKRSRFTELQV